MSLAVAGPSGTGRLAAFLCVCFLAIHPPVLAGDDRPALAGLTLVEAIETLRAEGLDILYSSDLIRPEMRVLADPGTGLEDLRSALAAILAPHGLSVDTGPGGLLVVVAARTGGRLRGWVRDRETGRSVPGVRLTVLGTEIEAESDRHGRFLLDDVPEGVHVLEAESESHAPVRVERVRVTRDAVTRIGLKMSARPTVEATVVVSAHDDWPQPDGPAPSDSLDETSILRTPRMTEDVMRVLEPLPGVVGRDESAALFVRGGAHDETLILLDGQELYDPFHLKDYQGFVSIVDSRTVGSVGVFSDAFPAQYGGRMSAVIDIDSLDPGEKRRTTVGLSTLDAHVLNSGSYRDGRGQWLVSGRGSFPTETEALERHALGPDVKPSYHDLFAKASYEIGPRTVIKLNALVTLSRTAGDAIDSTRFRSRADDQYVWFTLSNTWRPHLSSRTIVSLGDLSQRRRGSELGFDVADKRTTHLFGLKQDWLFDTGRHLVRWGLDVKKLRASYWYRVTESDPPNSVQWETTQEPSGTDTGVFAADRIRLHPRLDLELGVRWDRQTYVEHEDDHVSPRVDLAFRPGTRSAVRIGWGHYYQPLRINQLQVEDRIVEFSRAQRARQLSVRFEHRFWSHTRFRVSVYQKRMARLRPRFENLFNPLRAFPELAADRVRIDADRAEATGVELLMRTDPERGIGWWLGYALSSVRDEVEGRKTPRSWDQRHGAALGFTFRTPAWLVALTTSYHSGRPTTPVTADVAAFPDGSVEITPIVGRRNSSRLPGYNRLDLRITRTFGVRGGLVELYLNAANVYNRDNVCCVESFAFSVDPDGQANVSQENITTQPREVTAGLSWTF